MTKKTNTEPSTISRRATIAGAVSTAMGVAQAAVPDPIFAALERFGLAEEALSKAILAADLPQEQWLTPAYVEAQTELKGAYASFRKAQFDLLTTTPTTRAGLSVLLVRLSPGTDADQPGLLIEAMFWKDETRDAACTVLNRLAALVLKIA